MCFQAPTSALCLLVGGMRVKYSTEICIQSKKNLVVPRIRFIPSQGGAYSNQIYIHTILKALKAMMDWT